MKILIVGEHAKERQDLKKVLSKTDSRWKVLEAETRDQALELAGQEKPEVIFVDLDLSGAQGLELTKRLQQMLPRVNAIVYGENGDYALEAFQLYVSGFLMKPLVDDKVMEAMKNLRFPVVESEKKLLQVQCFGTFQVLADGKPLVFPRARSKEILAYLVDLRGASATTGELCGILWEDDMEADKGRHYVRNLLSDLRNVLKACGAEEVLIRGRNQYAVNTTLIDCDYYRYLEGDPEAMAAYRKEQEYMKQYEWAEL